MRADNLPPSPPSVESRLGGWGRFPVESCRVYRPESRSDVAALVQSPAENSFVSRGLGRSYGDAALNRDGGVISHLRLNRMLSFDPSSGVLECEAGVSFADIITTFLPQGFFPPVTPGTRFITVGGATANDVHGKNHHVDGTFGQHLIEITLVTPDGVARVCSREQAPDLFWATVGGVGLTGAVMKAKFRLRRVESAYMRMMVKRTADLEETLRAFSELDASHPYSVAWIDCLARGRSLGRSVTMFADHASAAELPRRLPDPLQRPARRSVTVPFDMPPGLLNHHSIRAFNGVYYRSHGNGRKVVPLDGFFFPLDAIGDWNRLYGKRGFFQYQVVLPEERGEEGVRVLLERLSSSGAPSFLAVLKRFGDQNEGLLSFPMRGPTLAVDLPARPETLALVRELDETVVRFGGRVYLGKDALLSPAHFRAMYPRAEEFERLKATVDPEGRISSSLARRLGIGSRAGG